jgi:hypothetical protein
MTDNEANNDVDKEPAARKFIAYFDILGFESLTDITSYERHKLLSNISGAKVEPPINFRHLLARASFNPQRSPEIWIFTSTVDEHTLDYLSKHDPQILADTIRECGYNVYGKHTHKRQVIT